jgi:hypothetical protein
VQDTSPPTLVRSESSRHEAADGKVIRRVEFSYPHLTTSGRLGRSGIAPEDGPSMVGTSDGGGGGGGGDGGLVRGAGIGDDLAVTGAQEAILVRSGP